MNLFKLSSEGLTSGEAVYDSNQKEYLLNPFIIRHPRFKQTLKTLVKTVGIKWVGESYPYLNVWKRKYQIDCEICGETSQRTMQRQSKKKHILDAVNPEGSRNKAFVCPHCLAPVGKYEETKAQADHNDSASLKGLHFQMAIEQGKIVLVEGPESNDQLIVWDISSDIDYQGVYKVEGKGDLLSPTQEFGKLLVHVKGPCRLMWRKMGAYGSECCVCEYDGVRWTLQNEGRVISQQRVNPRKKYPVSPLLDQTGWDQALAAEYRFLQDQSLPSNGKHIA